MAENKKEEQEAIRVNTLEEFDDALEELFETGRANRVVVVGPGFEQPGRNREVPTTLVRTGSPPPSAASSWRSLRPYAVDVGEAVRTAPWARPTVTCDVLTRLKSIHSAGRSPKRLLHPCTAPRGGSGPVVH